MKKINKSILAVGLVASSLLSFSSCQDEVMPQSSTATSDQVAASSKATLGLLWAMPAYFNNVYTDYHFGYGYGSIMHMRDVMTQDMPVAYSGYDHYYALANNTALIINGSRTWYIWRYYYKLIQTANTMISAVNAETATDVQKGYLGAALAFRALAYLDLAQMYEFKTNDKTSAVNSYNNDISGLTVPIVDEKTTSAASQNNPRATTAQMQEFILNDLNRAIEYLPNLNESSKTLPHLDCAYGLLARYYLWTGDYANAEKAARNAINNSSVQPITQAEGLSTTNGFNTLADFMWGSQQSSEDGTVQTGIINWTSWMSNETTFGYAGAGPFVEIDASLYNSMNDTDWRKLMFKAPEGTALEGKTPWIDKEIAANFPDYASCKFRPGEGNMEDFTTGAASAYPVMRVEEMYFIEAEAAAHQDAARGKQLLTDFMVNYRDPKYVTKATSQADVITEIIKQKRIELWGEGLSFFDVKRLNMSVTRSYPGTNWDATNQFNTNGRPAWMNIIIYQGELEANKGVADYNNPAAVGLYTAVSSN